MRRVRRASWEHWRELSLLLGTFERLAESCARLDAHRRVLPNPGSDGLARSVDERFDSLLIRVDRELDRVTAELLTADLVRKRARVAA